MAIYLLSSLFTYVQHYITATVTLKLSKQLRDGLSYKINRVPMKFFNTVSHGDILSRVTNDVDTIGQALNQSVASLVSSATMFLGALLMMLLTNVWMTLAAVAAALLGFAVMILIVQRSQKYFMQQQKNLGAMNGHVEEIYSGHNVVKVYNGEKSAREKFCEINENLGESAFRSQMFSGLMRPIMAAIGNLGYVAVCVTGAALAMNGKISFGVIVAFMMYVRQFTQPLQQFAQGTTNLQSAAY